MHNNKILERKTQGQADLINNKEKDNNWLPKKGSTKAEWVQT